VVVNGTINATDFALVKSRSGTGTIATALKAGIAP